MTNGVFAPARDKTTAVAAPTPIAMAPVRQWDIKRWRTPMP